jgi:prepilin-type N-terminal cleavage/methylation domain-containing protein
MKKIIKKEGGFNLIELLVVMAIIAVLIALVIAAINIARRGTRNTQRRSVAQTIKASLEDYYARNKSYPDYTWTSLTTIRTGLGLSTTDASDPLNETGRFCYKRGNKNTTSTGQAGKYVLKVRMEGAPGGTTPSCTSETTDAGNSEDFSLQ